MSTDIYKLLTYKNPIFANILLTYKCNFNCIHCYQKPIKSSTKIELNTNNWLKILDILKKNKILAIRFTGGEIFTRTDFYEIYSYAYKHNFKISLSTNASLINTKIMELLLNKPPHKMSVTLYGMSDDIYKQFTKKDAFYNVYNNIIYLANNNINIFVKIIANKYNKNELIRMKTFLEQYNIDFFLYFTLENYLNGNKFPQTLQLSEKEITFYQKYFNQLDEYLSYKKKYLQKEICSVGNNIVNIDPYGYMYLCECSQKNKWSLLNNSFNYCLNKIRIERKIELCENPYCINCKLKKYCNICSPLIKYRYGKLCKPQKECAKAAQLKILLENE